MDAVAVLPPDGGLISAACAALGLSRATFHRRQALAKLPPAPVRPRPKPARALATHDQGAEAIHRWMARLLWLLSDPSQPVGLNGRVLHAIDSPR